MKKFESITKNYNLSRIMKLQFVQRVFHMLEKFNRKNGQVPNILLRFSSEFGILCCQNICINYNVCDLYANANSWRYIGYLGKAISAVLTK